MRVRELMSTGIVTIDATASCQKAVEQMYRHKVRHLPVTGDDGKLVGIVTDRDLRHYLFAHRAFEQGRGDVDAALRSALVRNIMSSPAIAVSPDHALEAAATLMLQDKVGSLPVVEDGRPVGIITETDLLRQICRPGTCSPDVDYIVVSYP